MILSFINNTNSSIQISITTSLNSLPYASQSRVYGSYVQEETAPT